MRIAALVHNGVLHDARVIKEAMTLRAAGYEIAVHGISPNEQTQHHVLPGSDIEVFLEPRAAPRTPPPRKLNPRLLRFGLMWPLQLIAASIGGALLWWCALKFHASYAASYSHDSLLASVLLMGAAGGIAFTYFRRLQWRAVSAILARVYRARPPPRKLNPRLLRFGLMWPLQLITASIGGALLWWCALKFHASYAAIYSHDSLLAWVLLMGALGGIVFTYFRRLLRRAMSSILARVYRARHQAHAQAIAASQRDVGADVGDNFYRLTDALLASLKRQLPPDVIHLHDHVSLVLADKLKALYKLPIVWDAHEIYQELAGSDPKRAQANADIIAAKHPFIDYFITINESIARFYQEHYPRMPSPYVVMNASMPSPVPVYDGRLHDAAQLPREQKIILFQGGFSRHRGLPQLVEAAAALPEEWTLVMMGWGSLEAELRALASRHCRVGSSSIVVFLAGVPQHELQQWSAGASLGVIPYENTSLNHLYCTPNKLWEYPNAGVPVLCSDLIEMAAMLKQFQFGFLLPREFTSADIVSVVSGLSPHALATARTNCARFLAANNWSVWERNLLAVYADIRDSRPSAYSLAPSSNAA